MKRYQVIGFFLGILLFGVMLLVPRPEGMSPEAQRAAAVTLLMATWWITEAIPIYANGLTPMVLFPLLGVLDSEATARSYGDDIIILLVGGFFIAKSIETNDLHKRIALLTISRLGTSRRRIVLSFMIASAGLSMWIANISVALMMLPIGMAIIAKSKSFASGPEEERFALAVMLGIAYASSVGGTGTLIGTTPNLIFVGILDSLYPEGPGFSFLQWMLVGVPLVIIFIPIMWVYLCWLHGIKGDFPGSRQVIETELHALGPITTAERRVLLLATLTALGWIFRRDIPLNVFTIPGWSSLLGIEEYVHDATVAIAAALLLFVIPNGRAPQDSPTSNGRLLDWAAAHTVPWGVILIVGGGYAIGTAFVETGLADWLGEELTFIGSLPLLLLILSVVLFTTFVTEVNSNTATATIFLPIMATIAAASNVHPYLLMLPTAFACTFGFMLPSGTGPNAVVFASGEVTLPKMAYAGFWLDLLGVIVLTAVMYLFAIPLLGLADGPPSWAQ